MWQDTVREFMLAKISFWIRKHGPFEQRQAKQVPLNVVAVFAIIQQTYAVVSFTKVNPFVCATFKSRPIPGRILMRRTFDVAPLNLVGGARTKN